MVCPMTGERLLIVDDEENLRAMLAAALRSSGFEVHVAATGTDALEAVTRERPDLIVLDVMLPDLNGLEVYRHLRSIGDRTPILFVTAVDESEAKMHGIVFTRLNHLAKPFSISDLVARVRAGLRGPGDE